MLDRIGQGSLAQAAIEAALRSQAEAASKVQARALAEPLAGPAAATPAFDASLTQVLKDGVRAANASVASVDRLGQDMVSGAISDFHELPGRLKQAELTFKFSMEVRNKLIEAYREVMRMSV